MEKDKVDEKSKVKKEEEERNDDDNRKTETKGNDVPKKENRVDQDDKFGTKDNVADPDDAAATIDVTISKMNLMASIVKAEEISAANKASLRAGLQADLLVQGPLNGWGNAGSLTGYESYKIVDEIPSLVKIRSTKLTQLQTSLYDPDPAGWGKFSFVRQSIEAFSGNIELVDYILDSNSTFEKITYQDDEIPRTTLRLENFEVNPSNQPGIEDHRKRTSLMAGLLELIFKVRRAGDVFIRVARIETYGSMATSDTPLNALVGSKIPSGGQPNIYIGITGHELAWFSTNVQQVVSPDDLVIGETGMVVKHARLPIKMYSYYGVSTDSLFATLHYVFMKKFDHYKIRSDRFAPLLEIFAPLGGSVRLLNEDNNMELFFIMGLSRVMIDQYRFMFILSAEFRKHVISSMVTIAVNMEGLTTVPTVDVADVFETTTANMNNTTTFQHSLAVMIRPLSLNHFHEIMGLEVFHAFLTPTNPRRSNFASYQEAVLNLFAIGLDAIVTPNTFWSNIGLFSKALYDAFRILDRSSYDTLMEHGFTPKHAMPVDLLKYEVMNGEIPALFRVPLPGLIRDYMRAIRPCGENIGLLNGNDDISTSLNMDPEFYVPWSWSGRRSFGSITDTRVSDAVSGLAKVIIEFVKKYKSAVGLAPVEVGAITTLINQITQANAKVLGSVLQCEGNLIIRQLVNLPWLMYSTYRGEAKPNVSNFIGVYQTKRVGESGIPCNDENVQYPHSIGLWALLNLTSPQISKGGIAKGGGAMQLILPDPLDLYNKFQNDVRHCIQFAEAYGFMNMILNAHENDNIEFAFLLNVLGKNLKNSTVVKILNWLLPNPDEPIITYSNSVKLIVRNPDQRMRDPGIAHLNAESFFVDPSPTDGEVFRRPLRLIDPYEAEKFKIACTVIGDSASPLHKISLGVTLANERFDHLSPNNRHKHTEISVDYSDDIFPVIRIGDLAVIGFIYNDVAYTDVNSDLFPIDIRVVIQIPAVVRQPQWMFLRNLVMNKGWQLYFSDQLYIAHIDYVSSTAATAQGDLFEHYWKLLTGQLFGGVIDLIFRDTTSDFLNPGLFVSPSSYDQYVCAVDDVRRNVLLRNAYSLQRPATYEPPVTDDWSIGYKNPDGIPRDENFVPKYQKLKINFNNYLKVFTKEVDIGVFPKVEYIPPLIEDIFRP